MKMLLVSVLAIVASNGAAYAEPATSGEIGYPQGSIGYDALIAGDNDRAISEILASNRISRRDPAKMINLGQAYARTGRTAEAADLFTAAMESREEMDLVLADGRVISVKDAARRALANLKTKVATR
jgi:lipopolysaccharide biosynthesis regulator YciM